MHEVAAEKISEGLSLPARIILFIFSSLFGAIMFLTAPDSEKAIYFYAFSIFCFSIGIACISKGRVRQFIGSLIALAIVIMALWYLYSEVVAGVWFSGSRSNPSFLNAIFFSFAFGLPSVLYISKARFGFSKRNP